MAPTPLSYFTYHMPLGRLTIGSNGQALTSIAFGEQLLPGEKRATELTNRAANQLQEYFAGKRHSFDLPLAPEGTDFQKRVWKAIEEVPYGQTRSYSDIARAVGNPTACRAVGGANNRNPLPIIIPCHRIIGTNGALVGYGGGAKIKSYLLKLERRGIESNY